MKSFFVIIVFVVSTLSFVKPVETLAAGCQGSGCRYVCREEFKRCGTKKKACKRQYRQCLRDCPK